MSPEELREAIDRIGGGGGALSPSRGRVTGWAGVDGVFADGTLPAGVVQEWFGGAFPASPLQLLAHVVARADRGACVWVGRTCWPYTPRLMRGLVERSVFVAPRDAAARAWAIGLCLSSPAVTAVVADGSRFTLAATRRLQLAAQGSRALVLLARPESELGELSAAAMRWRVRPVPSPSASPRWSVELLRCKGLRPALLPQCWTLEESDDAGALVVVPGVADRPSAPPRLKLA